MNKSTKKDAKMKLLLAFILPLCFLLYLHSNTKSLGFDHVSILPTPTQYNEVATFLPPLDTTETESLVELSKRIAQLEIEIEQLRSKLRNNPENTSELKAEIKNTYEELNVLNDKIKGFGEAEAENLTNEVISLQEILNLESSIINKKEEIRKLERNLEYSNTPDEVVSLILNIENFKNELAETEKQLTHLEVSNKSDVAKKEVEQSMSTLTDKIKKMENNLDTTQTPERIVEMVVLMEDRRSELKQLQKGLTAIKEQQAGGLDWEKAHAYRIQNLLIYIHGVEEEIKDIKSSITSSPESGKSKLEKKLSMKEIELKELFADLDLAGGKYSSPEIDLTGTSKEIDLQSRIEALKQEILALRSDLNRFDISNENQERILQLHKNKHQELSDSVENDQDSIKELNITTQAQELVILIDNKENELAMLEAMLNASGDSKKVSWEGNLKYEDHTISSIKKYIKEVERSIQEQNNIINGTYSSSRKSAARGILSDKNNELQNLIAELELAGGTYVPGEIMVDIAIGSDAIEVTEKEPEPLFEKEKAKKKFKKGEKYLLKNVLFGFDKANIEKSSYEELNKLAQLLKEKSNKRVELSGHTDDWGPASYNQYLSEKRAQAVANYLSNKGIDKKRMVVKGYGETKPVAPNLLPNGGDNFEGRKKNRRTEIKVID